MSRIDELQRLHEDSKLGEDIAFYWPAIHRVLLAARKFLDQANVIGIYQPPKSHSLGPWPPVRPGDPNAEIELTQYADTYNALIEALRALDGGKGAT